MGTRQETPLGDSRSCHVDFEPVGRRGTVSTDRTLLDAARDLGVELLAICGGEGDCIRCKVQVLEGTTSPLSVAERDELSDHEKAAGVRLACQAFPLSDLKIHVPPESLSTPQRTQIEGLEVPVTPDPPVIFYPVELSPPSLVDLTADAERCRNGLLPHGVTYQNADIELLRSLSPRLRSWKWRAQLGLRGGELVAAVPPESRALGLAFDLGTTKIAGYLVELSSGRTLASRGTMNPQIAYGEDLVTRLNRARNSPTEAAKMRDLAVEGLNTVAAEMCASVGAQAEDVVEAVVVANTAMHHLLLRLPTDQLALAPYVPAVSSALDVKARDVGLRIASGGYLHVLPNIAGYVGADHVAMILATGIWKADGLVLALDIGTNTEICLSDRGQMTSVSAASGPAFEGAHIKYGMRAAPGAIEHVLWSGDRLEYQTIGGEPPVGICGSGILDILAQLLAKGVLDRGGRMADHTMVRKHDGVPEFVLAGDQANGGAGAVTLTQKDVREVQLAKGAIRTGIQSLLQAMNRSSEDIDQIIIAGAFGSYIDPASAVAIGMLPPIPLERIQQVGNAAGTGARMALISMEQRAQAAEIARRVRYVELSNVPNFARIFSQAIYLGQ
jgi:uncharacterized 2Fe-2S/4Fe-4S cluster protein (DUF4445 family)